VEHNSEPSQKLTPEVHRSLCPNIRTGKTQGTAILATTGKARKMLTDSPKKEVLSLSQGMI